MNHTPTPWVSELSTIYSVGVENKEADNGAWSDECLIGSTIDKANAVFIVRAVNCHEELVELIHKINYIVNLGNSRQIIESIDELKAEVKQAIAKAED